MTPPGPASTPAPGQFLDRSVQTRLLLTLGLGAVELLALSMWLDSETIAASGLMRLALKKLPDGLAFVVIAFVLALLIGGLLGWSSLRREIERRRVAAPFPWLWLALHAVFVGLFVAASFRMTSPGTDDLGIFVVWAAMAIGAIVTWLACLLPASLWATALVAGRGGIVAAVPVALAAWLIGRGARDLWGVLAQPTLDGVLLLLRSCGEHPVRTGAAYQLALRDFSVVIDPHCSGLEGVGAMAVFSSVYVWAMRSRLRFPQALGLIPLAMAASWCGNVLRIALLIEIGASYSPAVALGGFHSQAGWLFLIAVSVLVMGAAQQFRFFNVDARRSVRLRESAVAACLVPFILWQMIGIVSVLFSADPRADGLYPLKLFACLIPLWYWRALYARLLKFDAGRLFGAAAGGIAFGVWMLAEFALQATATVEPAGLGWQSPWRELWLASRIAGNCLAVPLIEELAFRGYLLRRVQSFRFEETSWRDVGWPGIAVSSLAFGALHGERWLAGALVGVIYALTARQTNRLSSAVIAHATTNALVTVYVLATHDYARWH